MAWADAFDRLIAAGHRHGEIMGYTLRQFQTYLDLAGRREREALRWSLVAPALAQAGGNKLKEALRKLKD